VSERGRRTIGNGMHYFPHDLCDSNVRFHRSYDCHNEVLHRTTVVGGFDPPLAGPGAGSTNGRRVIDRPTSTRNPVGTAGPACRSGVAVPPQG